MAVEGGGGRRLTSLGSVRLRTTIVATVVVAVAMIAGSVALVGLLRNSLEDGVEESVDRSLEATVAALERGGSPRSVVGDDDDSYIRIVDEDGRVVAASEDADDAPRVGADASGTTATTPDGDRFLVSADDADAGERELTVIVGQSLDDVDESAATARQLLLVGVPVLVVLVGVATWFVVGRAFAPVDRITREVDEITGADLGRRVSAPAAKDEIGRLARTMNKMLERLDLASRRQRQFVSDASHELRSPTAALRQHAEIALAYPGRIATDALAETVLEESLRVQRIVESLLLLARIDERTAQLDRRAVDVDDLLLTEARRLRNSSTLTIDTSAVGAARVRGDETLLSHVVRNLVDNAARHAASKIALGVRDQGGSVLVSVEDDGSGVPAPDRERIFERFVRLDEARSREAGGSGLGLAIVRELVALHGGAVRVVDGDLGGARFEVWLPS